VITGVTNGGRHLIVSFITSLFSVFFPLSHVFNRNFSTLVLPGKWSLDLEYKLFLTMNRVF
jgi:hypothetical protein